MESESGTEIADSGYFMKNRWIPDPRFGLPSLVVMLLIRICSRRPFAEILAVVADYYKISILAATDYISTYTFEFSISNCNMCRFMH